MLCTLGQDGAWTNIDGSGIQHILVIQQMLPSFSELCRDLKFYGAVLVEQLCLYPCAHLDKSVSEQDY